jgi:hypothetical protein
MNCSVSIFAGISRRKGGSLPVVETAATRPMLGFLIMRMDGGAVDKEGFFLKMGEVAAENEEAKTL